MKFRVNQKVVFHSRGLGSYRAKTGATAIVTELGSHYLRVKWIRNDLSGNQMDGSYGYADFEPVLQNREQLLFGFMEEV